MRQRVSGDVLFADEPDPTTAHLAHIICAVCRRPARIAVDSPARLCDLCMGDLPAARRHVAEVTAKVVAQLDSAGAAWERTVAQSPAAERWAKVVQAKVDVELGALARGRFDELWARRKAEGGPLAALMVAHDAHDAEVARIQEELGRLRRASDELDAARGN